MTKQEIQEELTRLGIEFTTRETKEELQQKLPKAEETQTTGKSYGVAPDDTTSK